MKKLTCYILSFIFVFLVIILSCERKRFDNPYDPEYIPDPPKLLSPQDGEICDFNPPFFEWEYLGEKSGYEIEINTSNSFDAETVFYYFLSHPFIILNDPSFEDITYFWRVRATVNTEISPLIWGEWSKTNSFRVRIPIISTFMCSLYIYGIKAVDSYVLVSDTSGCLSIFDFSDIATPVLISDFHVGNLNYIIRKVSDQLSYLYAYSDYYSFVEIVLLETSDLEDVKDYYRMFYNFSGFSNISITFDSFLIGVCGHVFDGPDSVVLFDVSNPYSVVQHKMELDCDVNAFFINNNTLFLSTGNKIYVYDINQIQFPILKDSLILQSFNIWEIDFLGKEDDYLYVESGFGRVEVFDIRDPIRPTPVGSFSDNVHSDWGGIENGYLTGYSGGYYCFYSLSSPLIPQLMGGLGVEYEFSVSQKYIFSRYRTKEIRIFEINE